MWVLGLELVIDVPALPTLRGTLPNVRPRLQVIVYSSDDDDDVVFTVYLFIHDGFLLIIYLFRCFF